MPHRAVESRYSGAEGIGLDRVPDEGGVPVDRFAYAFLAERPA